MRVSRAQYESKVQFMELLREKAVNYDDDIKMTLSVVKDDKRFAAAGDHARQWLLHYFTYQRQVTELPRRVSSSSSS